jgi:hypothetical protein
VTDVRLQSSGGRQPRKTLRLTFQVRNGEVRLVSHERLEMVCPPSIGERPEARRHGGFWMELRDAQDRVIFHRLLEDPVASSVEVHSPDGKIRREFGPLPETMFEVLVPDDADARSLVLMGEYLDPASTREVREGGARELIRFDVPTGERGGQAERSGGGDERE